MALLTGERLSVSDPKSAIDKIPDDSNHLPHHVTVDRATRETPDTDLNSVDEVTFPAAAPLERCRHCERLRYGVSSGCHAYRPSGRAEVRAEGPRFRALWDVRECLVA